jgi:hypothetical protein
MIVHRVPNALLYDVARVGEHAHTLREFKRKDDEAKNSVDRDRLAKLQEEHRLLRNYNYKKDTEEINRYCHLETQRENALIKSAGYAGLNIDRYI